MTFTADDLVGAWSLQSFSIAFEDGRQPLHPFGAKPRGQLIYTACGQMSAFLSHAQRGGQRQRIESFQSLTNEEKVAAFDTFLAYAGRWRIEGQDIVHDVEISMVPGAEGAVQRRHVRLEESTLILSYELRARSGVQRRYCLVWKRVHS